MKISSSNSTSNLPVETQIEGALLKKQKEMREAEGAQDIKLIESAIQTPHLKNRPLNEGPVGRIINVAA